MSVTTREYGTTKAGQQVQQFTIRNENGFEVSCINYGCRITNIWLPSPEGPVDVVLGFDTLADYEADTSFQGAMIGRYGNRIRDAKFTLDGNEYNITKNEGENYLHGSYHARVFEAEVIGDNSVSFTYVSPDGEDGFPGELWVGIIYTVTDQNELVIDMRAKPEAATVVNLTNHSYFNLAGVGSGTIENHELWLGCSTFVEIDEALCPTGRIGQTEGGAFDFTTAKPIGQDIEKQGDPQIKLGGGYDHCFIIDKQSPGEAALAATAKDPVSGRTVHLRTTQPALQFYAGNMMDGSRAKGGVTMDKRTAFCLEPEHYPDAPNQPEFPSTALMAGEKYHQVALFQFEW